jgi:hypothetical protein
LTSTPVYGRENHGSRPRLSRRYNPSVPGALDGAGGISSSGTACAGRNEWLPVGDQFHIIVGTNERGQPYLRNIATDKLIRVAQSILADTTPTDYPAGQKFLL